MREVEAETRTFIIDYKLQEGYFMKVITTDDLEYAVNDFSKGLPEFELTGVRSL
jgi:hypothetical protein